MEFNEYKTRILAEYIKDMYTAGMISKYGAYTEKANEINRRLYGRSFTNFFKNSMLHLDTVSETAIVNRLNDGEYYGIWLTEAASGQYGWHWHYNLPNDTTDDAFLEIINNNRKLYGLQKSGYSQSELSKAARLLDDEMQYEI